MKPVLFAFAILFDTIPISFELAFKIIKKYNIVKFINGPISKKYFLKKEFLGITEYISEKFLTKKTCMLIFNKKLSVCPITTHLPLKLVSKKITKKNIVVLGGVSIKNLKKLSLLNQSDFAGISYFE